MARRLRSPWWVLFFVIFFGALLGSVIAEAVGAYPAFAWLAKDVRAGIDPPLTLDLRVFTVTIGTTVRLNVSILLGIVIAVWIFRLLQ